MFIEFTKTWDGGGVIEYSVLDLLVNRYDGIGTRHKGALLKTKSTYKPLSVTCRKHFSFLIFYSEDGLNEVNRQLSHCPNLNRQPSRMQDFYRRTPKIVLNSK